MVSRWILQPSIIQTTIDVMRTTVHSSCREATEIDFHFNSTFVLRFDDIHYQTPGGETRNVRPISSPCYIQEPYVIMPQTLESDVGLRMVAQVMRANDGVIVDVRLETIADLESVSLSASFESSSTSAMRPIREGNRPWIELNEGENVVALAVGDMGEAGGSTSTTRGSHLTFFEQSLEKGVILVGRWGMIPRQADESTSDLRVRGANYLRQASFL